MKLIIFSLKDLEIMWYKFGIEYFIFFILNISFYYISEESVIIVNKV